MTEKEKAEELVVKYNEKCGGYTKLAFHCAIIAVDEIITSYKTQTDKVEDEWITIGFLEELKYWQEVKKEIEKL